MAESDEEFDYPLESIGEMSRGDALTIALPEELSDEYGTDENRLEVASVLQKQEDIVRVTFHSSDFRLWQVHGHLYFTDSENNRIEGTEPLSKGLSQKVLGTAYED